MQQPGGQIYGPADSMGRVKVHTICRGCYDILIDGFSRAKASARAAAAGNGVARPNGVERLVQRQRVAA